MSEAEAQENWRHDDNTVSRDQIIVALKEIISGRNPNISDMQLENRSSRLEEELYNYAPTLESYCNIDTLKDRVRRVRTTRPDSKRSGGKKCEKHGASLMTPERAQVVAALKEIILAKNPNIEATTLNDRSKKLEVAMYNRAPSLEAHNNLDNLDERLKEIWTARFGRGASKFCKETKLESLDPDRTEVVLAVKQMLLQSHPNVKPKVLDNKSRRLERRLFNRAKNLEEHCDINTLSERFKNMKCMVPKVSEERGNIQLAIKEILLTRNPSIGTKPLENRSRMFEEEMFKRGNQEEHYNVDTLQERMKEIRRARRCEGKEEHRVRHGQETSPERAEIVAAIKNILLVKRPNLRGKPVEVLDGRSLRLERKLFNCAPNFEAHNNFDTLEDRVEGILKKNENGEKCGNTNVSSMKGLSCSRRKRMMTALNEVMRLKNPKMNEERLMMKCKRLDFHLFQDAPSIDAYCDSATLEKRLKDVMMHRTWWRMNRNITKQAASKLPIDSCKEINLCKIPNAKVANAVKEILLECNPHLSDKELKVKHLELEKVFNH